jgi:hypothetical protein
MNLFALAFDVVLAAQPACDLAPAVQAAVDRSKVVFLGATASRLAIDAAEALQFDPRLPCDEQRRSVEETVALWIAEGSVQVIRDNQQILPVLRKFGAVKIVGPADVAKIRVVYRGEERVVANGTVVCPELGEAELALYNADTLLCKVSFSLRPDREEVARCHTP